MNLDQIIAQLRNDSTVKRTPGAFSIAPRNIEYGNDFFASMPGEDETQRRLAERFGLDLDAPSYRGAFAMEPGSRDGPFAPPESEREREAKMRRQIDGAFQTMAPDPAQDDRLREEELQRRYADMMRRMQQLPSGQSGSTSNQIFNGGANIFGAR